MRKRINGGMVGDLDNNSLDDNNIESEKNFLSMIFQSGFLPLMQRRTRATRKTDIAIDHIITDAILKSTMHSRIIKTNRFDQISMFIILRNSCKNNEISHYAKIKWLIP